MRRRGVAAALFFLTAMACAVGGGFEARDPGPPGTTADLEAPGGILAYGAACAARMGSIPSFDCRDGVVARITVDGVEPAPGSYLPDMTCDRPALLPPDSGEVTDGQCVPYSRALVLRDDAETQIAAFCRQKLIRPEDTFLYDEIDVIAHDVRSGSTCWFQAKADNPRGDPAIGLDGRRVPPPDEAVPPPGAPPAATFWRPPAETAGEKCVRCHDNDPFYYSPFVAQTGQLPANPFGRYANDIGEPFRAWPPPVSLEPRGNTCTGCHRIGATFTCGRGARESVGLVASEGLDEWARRYPQSHWMPVANLFTRRQWDVIYEASVEQLESCCGPDPGEGCRFVPIPGGEAVGSPGEAVGSPAARGGRP
ncbi:MAG: hypothetical protein R3266_00945 [Gemmatimonadota bacterium]|nr:hypothetical protein [Gemmatimonadota bacterium]